MSKNLEDVSTKKTRHIDAKTLLKHATKITEMARTVTKITEKNMHGLSCIKIHHSFQIVVNATSSEIILLFLH